MTERTHAFLAARYYEYLTSRFGDRGKAAFVHATRYYAEQRGRRMARAPRSALPRGPATCILSSSISRKVC